MTTDVQAAGLFAIPLAEIKPSKTNPRRVVNGHAFDELAASVAAHGVLQPVLVRPTEKGYELVAGHRRFAAAQKAGLERIPAAVRDLTDVEALEIQLIENLERSDLHPLEEAHRLHPLCSALRSSASAPRRGRLTQPGGS